jgi:hypothetical protein
MLTRIIPLAVRRFKSRALECDSIKIMLVFARNSHVSLWGRSVYRRDVSYALAVFLTLVAGLFLASITRTAWSANGGSYAVNAVVPAPRPTKPAVITSPANGASFDKNPIDVVGTCQAGSIVKIFKNGILAGSVICDSGGHFKLPIDLVVGRNDLTAVPYNILDQPGPTSATVTVTLTTPPGGFGFSTELILQSVNYYRGIQPGEEISWPIEIVGGLAPYAVSIDWGDGTTDLVTRLAPGSFTVKHTYKKFGTGYMNSYPLIIRATDSAGHQAYLQLTTIVGVSTGTNSSSGGAAKPTSQSGLQKLLVIWPLWIVILLMIISFWLGERREKHIMQKHMAALA